MLPAPLVSVIIPLYNKRPYIGRAIESVRGQSYANWEAIIADDGSTDNPLEEIPLGDRRIRYIRDINMGPGAARNRGIKIAKGDYITFLDADDYYHPEKLEKDVTALFYEKKARWMISAHEFEKNGTWASKYIRKITGEEISGEPAVFDNAFGQLALTGGPPNGICMEKRLIERLGGFREDMRFYEITDFLIRSALNYPRVYVLNRPTWRVVDVGNSASKIKSHHVEASRLLGEALYELSTAFPRHSGALGARSRHALANYVSMLISLGRNYEARAFLTTGFPFGHDLRWWKLWLGSWLPDWVIKRILKRGKIRETARA